MTIPDENPGISEQIEPSNPPLEDPKFSLRDSVIDSLVSEVMHTKSDASGDHCDKPSEYRKWLVIGLLVGAALGCYGLDPDGWWLAGLTP